MSQTVPPHLEGQIDSPNRLEFFWEKNKRIVTFGLIAAAIAIAINYLVQYQIRRSTAEKWSALAVASKLDRGYSENGPSWSFVEQQLARDPNNPQALNFLGFYLQQVSTNLVQGLGDDIKVADSSALQKLAEGSDARAPLAQWLLANRALEEFDFDTATRLLKDLQSRFPTHFLCRESGYPVQWRDLLPEEKTKEAEAARRPKDKPKRVEAKSGSEVSLMLARIDREKAFRAEHAEFYTPVEPTSSQTVALEIENAGVVKIKLFDQRAPKHAEKFLALVAENWWVGQRVHEIRRAPKDNPFNMASASELAFGWTSSKEDDDAKWVAGDVDPAHLVDWEDTGLSHFPGTVAVEAAADGKSQVERVVINGDDVAGQSDGTRVIIGRVVEGLDVVRDIISSGFADASSDQTGRGKPEVRFTIKSVKVE